MTLSSIKHQALLAWWVNSIFDNKAIPNTFLLILKSDGNKSVVICFLEFKWYKGRNILGKMFTVQVLIIKHDDTF